SEDWTRDRADKLREAVGSVVYSMGWLAGYRPFRQWKYETTESGFRGSVRFLVGAEEQTDPVSGDWSLYLVDKAVYVTNPAGDAVLEVSPFMNVLADETTQKLEHLYLIKKVVGDGYLIQAHDATGSTRKTPLLSGDNGKISFQKWLDSRRLAKTLWRPTGTSSGLFALDGGRQVPTTGGRFGARYVEIDELGHGGMATVYRVRDRVTNKEVALKVLGADFLGSSSHIERFFREAAAMQQVHHRCIVPVMDIDTLLDGRPYLRMPIYRNGSLQKMVVDGGQPEQVVRAWAEDALEALECIHNEKIIHRDLKPSNFLVADDGHVLLTDFGIALAPNDERLTLTMDRADMGTRGYMAPELGRFKDPTPKVDIYSLAVVLHELLTGELPRGVPGKDIEGGLGLLVRRMGQADPDDRPTAAEALSRLRKIRPRSAATAQSQIATTSPPTPSRRRDARTGRAMSAAARANPTPATPSRRKPGLNSGKPPVGESVAARAEQQRLVREFNERRTAEARRSTYISAALILGIFVINFVETWIETSLRSSLPIVLKAERLFADAAQWFEFDRLLSFEHHDMTNVVAYKGYSFVYFIVFPSLLIMTTAVLVMRRNRRPLLMYATAAAADYLLTLPFYVLMPVPERWTFDPQAMLLSDRWSSTFIAAFRPFSGLNNCFPSFHVSVTVLTVLCLYKYRVRFRAAAVPIACAIALSTFVLGIHWVSDVIAGVCAGIISFWAAERILARYFPAEPEPLPVPA
ncbi:MAG TPA: protein kinase, partial [Thermoanaerobaculia bacterium]|nr:protein kinase [Thermoanaerobaculia bacterium]